MPRRVSMPGADELFRSTAQGRANAPSSTEVEAEGEPKAHGRAKHDEKMTVYLTMSELHDVERARLELRGTVGKKVDRGRLVRAALALALEDLAEHGADSRIARRLSES